ncbi:MAG: hypothetical protein MZV63_06575 [Marinilabiliales bacterium]|nr:hypothetical protein [Marinilabiliales bacterium]
MSSVLLGPRIPDPRLPHEVDIRRDDQRIGEVDEERAHHRQHQERPRRVPEPLHERLHVGHGVRRGAEAEPAVPSRHDGRVVVASHDPERDEVARTAAIIVTCTVRMTSIGTARSSSSHSLSDISAIARNSDSAMVPRSSTTRWSSLDSGEQSSPLRMTAPR